MNLFFRQYGQGKPLVILHGLFGSSDNWHSLGKVFSEKFSVYLVDQRNHGQSPHRDEMDYQVLTEDLEDFFKQNKIERAHLIGHSMGGKTVMNFAVKNPSLVDRLIVVDIVPKYYKVHHDRLIEGMKSIPLDEIASRSEADVILSGYEPDVAVRQFLLKNLGRDDQGKFFWRFNLQALYAHLEEIGAGMQYNGTFDGDSLFINGKKSNYFSEGDDGLIRKLFPRAQFTTLDTGHWVQAENAQAFAKTVFEFLK
ncbi:MAG: alpha/beta fold hydrolase [Bacteroidetes bacterium]|nr:alpha/beta fold hydrolase [Bacteroidota bacterium]